MCWKTTAAVVGVFAGAVLVPMDRAFAQTDWENEDGRSERSERWDEGDPTYRERAISPQELRDHGFPDPDRPFGRPRYLDRPYRRPRAFLSRDARPPRYRGYYEDDYSYRFGRGRYGYRYDDELERAYRQGIADGQSYERFEIQAERGLATYRRAMAEGHAAFEAGRYELAARQFLLGATVNQGDPASRLCAAHAHFALAAYEPAVRLLQRAFELQPKWIYLPLDIRGAYGKPEDFAGHLRALRRTVEVNREDAGLWLLLGYYQYYSGDTGEAKHAMTSALQLAPDDEFVSRFAELVGVPAARSAEPKSKRKSQRTAHDL